MTTIQEVDWTKMGQALRESALDAHGAVDMPNVDMAYDFLLDNPECFGEFDEWPADMPQLPNIELIAAYYTPDAAPELAQSPRQDEAYVWLKIGIRQAKHSDGIDLKIGDMIYRNITGLNAERLAHEEIRNAIDAIADAQSSLEPGEPDYELEQDRYSGTPDHRWPA